MILAAVAFAIGLLQAAAVAVPTNGSAEAFVRQLYQREAHETRADEEAFSGHQGSEAIYSPSLLALIRRDLRNTPKGYVGKLDYDPICGCQDYDGMSVQTLKVVSTSQSTSRANVTLHFGGVQPQEITLMLVHLTAGWRVDNVDGPKGFQSLRKLLTNTKH